jgi:uncharacterized membrane protein HdeD (DUF308 family)
LKQIALSFSRVTNQRRTYRVRKRELQVSHSLTNDIHRAATWSIALSILMISAGIIAVFLPALAGVAVTAVIGWLLIFSGLLHVAFAWRANKPRTVLWEILLGVVYGAVGIYLVASPLGGLQSLTIAVAIYLLIEGVLELVLSFELRPAPGAGWLLFDAIVTLVLAALIWSTWPSSAIWVVGTLVGISMLFSGITRLMFSMALRRIAA